MKRNLIIGAVLLMVIGLSQSAGWAKLVSGRVISVAENVLTVKRTNPITGADEEIRMTAQPETSYYGVAALAELAPDDQVWVEAEQDKEPGVWKAVLVKKA